MPTYSMQAPNGKTYEIEGPAGATPAQVRAEIMRRDPSAAQVEQPAEKPVPRAKIPFTNIELPDINPLRVAGKVQDYLAEGPRQLFRLAGKADVASGIKTPEQAERRAKTYANVTRDVAEAAAVPWSKVPGWAGLGIRSLQSGALGGVQRAAETDSLKEAGKSALVSAALQPVAEGITYGLGRIPAMARGAKQATKEYDAATAARDFKIKHDKAMTGALNEAEAAAHQTAATRHAEEAASGIAADLKQNVPALADLPSDTKGLLDMVYGSGKQKVSSAFDEAMQQVAERGAGQKVQIPEEAARRLGLKIPEDPLAGLSAMARNALERAGRLPPAGAPGMVTVDAAELAKRATGFWKKDAGAYRAAVNALDAADIGDPAARAAYKYYSGIVQYLDKTKALAGEQLNPAALIKGGTSLRTIEELRRRGIGDVFRGPMQVARGAPVAPAPRQVPPAPAELVPPDIATRAIPGWAKHMIGATPAAAIGGAVGGPIGAAIGYPVGATLGHLAIPSQVITRAPLSPAVERFLTSLPGDLGVLAREALIQRQPTLEEQAEQFRSSQQGQR